MDSWLLGFHCFAVDLMASDSGHTKEETTASTAKGVAREGGGNPTKNGEYPFVGGCDQSTRLQCA